MVRLLDGGVIVRVLVFVGMVVGATGCAGVQQGIDALCDAITSAEEDIKSRDLRGSICEDGNTECQEPSSSD